MQVHGKSQKTRLAQMKPYITFCSKMDDHPSFLWHQQDVFFFLKMGFLKKLWHKSKEFLIKGGGVNFGNLKKIYKIFQGLFF